MTGLRGNVAGYGGIVGSARVVLLGLKELSHLPLAHSLLHFFPLFFVRSGHSVAKVRILEHDVGAPLLG